MYLLLKVWVISYFLLMTIFSHLFSPIWRENKWWARVKNSICPILFPLPFSFQPNNGKLRFLSLFTQPNIVLVLCLIPNKRKNDARVICRRENSWNGLSFLVLHVFIFGMVHYLSQVFKPYILSS